MEIPRPFARDEAGVFLMTEGATFFSGGPSLSAIRARFRDWKISSFCRSVRARSRRVGVEVEDERVRCDGRGDVLCLANRHICEISCRSRCSNVNDNSMITSLSIRGMLYFFATTS